MKNIMENILKMGFFTKLQGLDFCAMKKIYNVIH